MYSTTRHAIKGFTDALRKPMLPPPLYATKEVAHGILHAAVHPRRDIYIGGAGRFMSILNRVAPALMDQFSKTLIPQSFRDEPPRHPEGALHQAGIDGVVDSDHPGHVMQTSLYTRASLHPAFGFGLALLVSVGLSALAGSHWTRKGWS